MKQGTLNFTSSKRTSFVLVDAKSKKPATSRQLKHAEEKPTITEDGDEPNTAQIETSSDEDSPAIVPSKRTRGSLSKRGLRGAKSTPKRTEEIPTTPERETLDVEDKAGRYRRYYNEVREKMGYVNPSEQNTCVFGGRLIPIHSVSSCGRPEQNTPDAPLL